MSDQSKHIRLEYPALYRAADDASMSSQKNYLIGFKFYLWLSIFAALLTSYIRESKEAGILAAILFLAILFLTVYQAFKRFDKTWYNGRAVAESVKTRTWRFIMRSEPYFNTTNISVVKREFCSDLNDILSQNQALGGSLTHPSMTEETISLSMLEIRRYSFQDRLKYYIDNRINEQRDWYYTKAKHNKRLARNWFYGLVATHGIVIIFLLIEIAYEYYTLPTSTIIVLGTSILSWIQIKRYQDLSTSYSLASHEIGILKSQSFEVKGEESLSDFIKDAENAFSREHTQWVARKDKT
ncbi:MAG: DUF4231 domain-containing protein [Allomuricauda sp.]